MRYSVDCRICFGLFYFFMFANVSTGYITYFPLTDVHLTFPFNEQIIDVLLKNPPFLRESSNNSYRNRFHYEIDDTQNYLSINEVNGEIRIEDKIKKLGENVTFTISANLANIKMNPTRKVARMSLTIVPVNTSSIAESCKNFERICFWDKAMYAVPENKLNGNKVIGSLAPNFYRKICPNLNVKYSLTNATTYFAIESNLLLASTRFDHDSASPGPTIVAAIRCEVFNKLNGEVNVQMKQLRINVLDLNDNPPEVQEDDDINIKLEDPHFTKGTLISSDSIMFNDKDSISVNSNITYAVLSDTLEIIHPACNAFENDLSELKSTAISCKLFSDRSGILSVSPYCFGLLAMDTTVDMKQNFVFKSSSAKICLTTNVSKIHAKDQPAAQALQSKSSEDSSSSDESGVKNPYVGYPERVTINRRFTFMARVTQPNISRSIPSRQN